ncbi:MAG: hypothetical protein AAF488_02085 [Planctomycetota bacterium]
MATCYDTLDRDQTHRRLARSCDLPISHTGISDCTLFLELGRFDGRRGGTSTVL